MAGGAKARKHGEKTKNSATAVKYLSPLNRLCESIKGNREHQMSEAESDNCTSNVVIAFPTQQENDSRNDSGVKQIISLDNGLNDQENVQPPLPVGPPPSVKQIPSTSGASNSSNVNDNMQGFMSAGLATLGKEIANSFAHTMADLNTSIRGGFDSLRDRLDGEEGYYDEEEGEIRDDNEDDEQPQEQQMPVLQKETPIVPLATLTAAIVKDDGRGPKVDKDLSANIEILMRNKPDETVQKNLFDSIKQPEGCEGLSQITVNPSIWEKMSNDAKGNDGKLQKVQLALVKGTTELVRAYDEIMKLVRDDKEVEKLSSILEIANNSLMCFGIANVELAQRRREAIKPGFENSYAHLFNASMPFTEALFGNELTKNIKDITEDNKLINTVVRSQRGAIRGRFMNRGFRARNATPYQRQYVGTSYNANYGNRGNSFRGKTSFSHERTYKKPYQQREPQNYKRGTRQRRN